LGAAHDLRSSEGGGSEDLPRKFDRYDLLKKLATGGMAEIYLAKQSGLEGFEKVVVLKRILSHLAQDEEFVSMFLDEARIAAKLSHPNIVQIYDLGKADGTYYIAMEYVSGRNVQHIITKQQERGEPVPVEHVCRVIAGVCDGLHYAHSRKDYDGTPLNIVHRDISPQNILVSFAGGVKVVDFGIAKASTQLAQTRAGVLKGKYAYMSPEQVRGAKIDARSDIFAVGLVFYEMLTGTRAFERDSSLKTLKAIVQEKPLNPRELNPEVPMEVVKLLSKALEKNPDRRYKTAQEMQLAIEDYLESSPKKSNNVRLSRYMYDLFDDELNSADGTMVVKGIGEVIIPASQGHKPVPRMEEDVDHKTLSAALMPAAPGDRPPKGDKPEKADGDKGDKKDGVRLVRSERDGPSGPSAAAQAAKPERSKPEPRHPVEELLDDDDDDVGDKTVPAYDAESYERERLARGKASDDEGEDRTTAGVPPPSASTKNKPARADDADARAAELLRKVEQMAADGMQTRTGGPAVSNRPGTEEGPADVRWDGATQQASGTDSLEPKESMIVGPNGRIDAIAGIRPPARPQVPAAPITDPATSDTPPPGLPTAPSQRSRPARPARAQAAKLPTMFYAAMAAIIGLFVLSAGGIVVILTKLGPVEYGVVSVVTDPPNAHVFIDGEDLGESPAQTSLPVGHEFTVLVNMNGYEPAEKTYKLDSKMRELQLALDQKR
jgi:serine/threonine protein kinase